MSKSTATFEPNWLNFICPGLVCDGVYFTRFDTYETDQELLFRCLMPYVELARVEARLRKGELVVLGKVRLHQVPPSSHGGPEPVASFYRSFTINQPVAEDRISVHFQDGVLTVRLPKTLEKQTAARISGEEARVGKRNNCANPREVVP